MTLWIAPVTLSGRHVTLVPLEAGHASALGQAIAEDELWRLWFTSVPTPEDARAYVELALAQRDRGVMLPFVVIEAGSGRIVGSTRYCNVDAANQRLEIGYTWYARRVQRSAINTECKLMLLSHAFETLDAIAVEFRTHWFNHTSRRAIERLGAKQDGVLRNHQKMSGGGYRDTVVYSIIASEWPTVRQHLRYQLERPRAGIA